MRIASLREGAGLALDQIRANKFRSGLTILGIVVGVATVMAMSAMIQGIQSTIMAEMEAVGPKNFVMSRYDMTVMTMGDRAFHPPITVAEVRRLEQLPTIRRAIGGINTNGEFVAGRQRLPSVAISGTDYGWTAYTSATISAGHDMMPRDVSASAPVVLLSTHLAESLFGQLDPVGRTVRINGAPFEVIGIVQMSDNIFSAMQRNVAIMPYTSMIKHLRSSVFGMQVSIVPTAAATQEEAMDQVIMTMRTMRGLRPAEENNFAVIRQEEFLETFNRVTGVFFMVMIALSSVALMVGGVGVVAIMMIAVTERTREIGIRKAIGATRREILWQFLFESITVTAIGAIIGMAIGAGLAFLVAAFTPIPASVPLNAVLAALGMAVVAGVVFGMWPAWRAARMDPVEALRYE